VSGERIEVMHGVNLDVLDRRDPRHYGGRGLIALEREIEGFAAELDLRVRFFQTNFEGEMVERLHRLDGEADGILINAGAWTHYAWAIRDALEIAALPAVEVHLSDVQEREPWRRLSIFDGLCVAKFSGHGPDGYRIGLGALREAIEKRRGPSGKGGG
jgi:3-dehydroquinate dehydratase II